MASSTPLWTHSSLSAQLELIAPDGLAMNTTSVSRQDKHRLADSIGTWDPFAYSTMSSALNHVIEPSVNTAMDPFKNTAMDGLDITYMDTINVAAKEKLNVTTTSALDNPTLCTLNATAINPFLKSTMDPFLDNGRRHLSDIPGKPSRVPWQNLTDVGRHES
jgi:hypothetical protein